MTHRLESTFTQSQLDRIGLVVPWIMTASTHTTVTVYNLTAIFAEHARFDLQGCKDLKAREYTTDCEIMTLGLFAFDVFLSLWPKMPRKMHYYAIIHDGLNMMIIAAALNYCRIVENFA